MAEEEATEVLEMLTSLVPIMERRMIDKHDTYGSIYQYGVDKFLVNLASNYGQFVAAAVYGEKDRARLKAADMMNVLCMILKVMEK